ncbi:MAG: ATP-binding protein, partial [Pseudomonadota bacterium]
VMIAVGAIITTTNANSIISQTRIAPRAPLASISRRAPVRVFFAMPVVVGDHVIGSVYLSRTPIGTLQQFYRDREPLLQALVVTLLATLLIGGVFTRLLTRPLSGLSDQATRLAEGDRSAAERLPQYGTMEVARLGARLLEMAQALHRRADTVASYTAHVTHELKSPITAIAGAVELLRDADDSMTPAQRQRFLDNIARDAERMTRLLDQMRSLAAAQDMAAGGVTPVKEALAMARSAAPNLTVKLTDVPSDAALPLSPETTEIVLTHLAKNAAEHGATLLTLTWHRHGDALKLRVQDNGPGISTKNRNQVFQPFFTTKRDRGGTGMGLAIVESLVASNDGAITLADTNQGTAFDLSFPAEP